MATVPVRYTAADRRQQILDVALRLFARKGFEGTTTRQVAAGAGVNEALIFRHFPSKEELYWAVIEQQCERAGAGRGLREKLGQKGSDREIFAALALEILERRSRTTDLSRLLLFTALENHRLSHRFFSTYVAEYYDILSEHVRKRIEQGRFRQTDPLLAARAFLGMVVYHSWVQELFGWKPSHKFENRQVADTLTDIWLQGMLAGGSATGVEALTGSSAGRRERQNGSGEQKS
jgi:AcrR family transcriptional regulator